MANAELSPTTPPGVAPQAWDLLPLDLRQAHWLMVAKTLQAWQRARGAEEGRRIAHLEAFLRISRQASWRKRPEQAKPCPGCGSELLYRTERVDGRRRRVGFNREGLEHACPAPGGR